MTTAQRTETPSRPSSTPPDAPAPLWRLRLAGSALGITTLWYVPWLINSVNDRAQWLSWPFITANLLLLLTALVTCVNNWHRSTPADILVPRDDEPLVAVLVPTAGEPVGMVGATVRSVLEQDWPTDRLCVLVGDDSRRSAVKVMVESLARAHPEAVVHYYQPPARGSASRRGDAKAGNLNAGLDELDRLGVPAELIETRDADDLVGDANFLRRTVGHLVEDAGTAYVQTIKEAHVAPGDPFGNTDALFYRGAMFARHAANSVFPCGSGLVWSRRALDDIGGFPTWNLVEDLQSGVEALRRGWRGCYVPIVGAVGQTAPEDLVNARKQRGTWCLDTVRLLVWGNLQGLSWRQRLQFLELGLFYLQSIAMLVFLIAPAIGLLFGLYPLVSTQTSYAIHFWPVTICLELFLLSLNGRNRWESLLRSRQLWVGLAPTYAWSTVRALAYGPRRKPTYTVTRKTHAYAWYWRECLVQYLLVAVLLVAVLRALLQGDLVNALDVGSAYWAAVSLLLLGSFLPRSWHGVRGAPVDGPAPEVHVIDLVALEGRPEHASADRQPIYQLHHSA